ncbi:unnamed protein product [Lampetra fluviatilis]
MLKRRFSEFVLGRQEVVTGKSDLQAARESSIRHWSSAQELAYLWCDSSDSDESRDSLESVRAAHAGQPRRSSYYYVSDEDDCGGGGGGHNDDDDGGGGGHHRRHREHGTDSGDDGEGHGHHHVHCHHELQDAGREDGSGDETRGGGSGRSSSSRSVTHDGGALPRSRIADVSAPPAPDACRGPGGRLLRINVGGKRFRIPRHAVTKYPRTRLGRLAGHTEQERRLDLCDDFSPSRREYFFDRDPLAFAHVFNWYSAGTLWVRDSLCPRNFIEELEYWGVRPRHAKLCCRILFEERQDEISDFLKVQRELEDELESETSDDCFDGMRMGEVRRGLWTLTEKPLSSFASKLVSVTSTLFLLLSIAAMTLNTMSDGLFGSGAGGAAAAAWGNHPTPLDHVETVCIAFFTAEYLLRLLCTPNLRRFMRSVLNAVDVIAIIPFYIQVMFEQVVSDRFDVEVRTVEKVGKLGQVLRIMRLMRIFRILKLARHSTGMRAFGFTLRQCYHQVGCLFLFIAIGIFIFSALVHSAEHDSPGTNFTSIPGSWWWAAVSISQVGYGDIYPETVLGQAFAFCCISFGIILNSLPISILYNKFSGYYNKLKEHECTSRPRQRGRLDISSRAYRKLSRVLSI